MIEIIRKIKILIKNPYKAIYALICNNEKICSLFSDEIYLKFKYRAVMDEKLDLNNPMTYNEKLQWLKLHDRKPEYTSYVDKYEVKKIVEEKLGDNYVVPNLGIWSNFDDINFDLLPNKFVLKCTHDSGGVVICKEKLSFNILEAKEKIEKSLNKNFYYLSREWPYKNVKPRIIAEKFLEDENGEEVKDYKVYCFDGEMKFLSIISDRQNKNKKTQATFFDRYFNVIDINWGFEKSEVIPKKPYFFDELIRCSEILSKNIPASRIDFYHCGGKLYFGEITLYDGGGFDKIEPKKLDYEFGSYIKTI